MDLRARLAAGDVEGFNAARKEGALDLFASELAEVGLDGVDLSQATLDKSDLSGASLRDARLVRATLEDVDADGIVLVDAVATRVRFRDARLSGADLRRADFTEADFGGADLDGSTAEDARFAVARMKGATARKGRWGRADLSDAHLRTADLSGIDLREAVLSGTDFTEANLTGAHLQGATGSGSRWTGAQLAGANFDTARLPGADFGKANLAGASFKEADLARAHLAGADLRGAVLCGAVLTEAVLDGALLDGVDLTGVDLSGVDVSSLPLDSTQQAALGRSGVTVVDDAPWVQTDPAVAAIEGAVVAVWDNADDETNHSIRWARAGRGGASHHGVLQVPPAAVIGRFVAATGAGGVVGAVWARPGSVVVGRWVATKTGLEAGRTATLGYTPAVRPGAWAEGNAVFLASLTREGPALVVHRLDADGEQLVGSTRMPTARGLLGRGQPVVVCKGGVVAPVEARGTAIPRKAPATFDEAAATAATAKGTTVLAWKVARKGTREPGGMRAAVLVARGEPDVLTLSEDDLIVGMDAAPFGDVVAIAWLVPGQVSVACVPEGDDSKFEVPSDASAVRWAPAVDGREPQLVVMTPGGLRLYGMDGSPMGHLDRPKRTAT